MIVPVAINLPPLTSSNVIGLAIAPSGCSSGTRRLSPPGNNGARIDGTRLGGTSRKALVEVGGQRYVFKMLAHNSTRLQRERFALDVRRAAGDPTLQVFAKEVASEDLGLHGRPGRVKGMLKPFIHNRGPLGADVKSWSRNVRASLLSHEG